MAEVIYVGIEFVILLTVFHILLFSSERIKKSGTLWHAVDYLWLGTAAVALAFGVLEVQRLRLNGEITARRADARGELNKIRMNASSVALFEQGQPDKDGGHKGGEWFKRVSSELELGYDSFRWRIFLSQNYDDLVRGQPDPGITPSSYILNPLWQDYKIDPVNTSPVLLEDARIVVKNLDNLSRAGSEINKLEDELKSKDTPLRLYWPWFLCLALALRMTKVTADLLRYRESVKTGLEDSLLEGVIVKDNPTVTSDAP